MDWSMHSYLYSLLILVPALSYGSVAKNLPYCRLIPIRPIYQYEYYQEGDVMIGGLVSVHERIVQLHIYEIKPLVVTLCDQISFDEYRAILAFIFAVDEINQDPDLLPNVTLGYHIFDTCGDPKKTLHYTLRILSGQKKMVPNYSCMAHGEVVAFVGDSEFLTSHALSHLLSLYKYTQINYGVTDHRFNNRQLYPTFYRVVPDDRVRYAAIIQCLKYFGWNFIGIITQSDGSAEMEYTELRKMMVQHKICVEFAIMLSSDKQINKEKMAGIGKRTARVLVVCGLYSLSYLSFLHDLEFAQENFTLILHGSWLRINIIFYPILNNSLLLMLPYRNISKLDTMNDYVDLSKRPLDPLLNDIWLLLFKCLSRDKRKNHCFQSFYNFSAANCTEIPDIAAFNSMTQTKAYYTYTIVHVLAHVIRAMNLRSDQARSYNLVQKINYFLKNVHYMDHNREDIFFNEQGSVPSPWLLANWVILLNGSICTFVVNPLAFFEESTRDDLANINKEEIIWKNGREPKSRCNDECSPGYRKAPNGGHHVCCYDCVPCSEAEISNITDSEICHKCPEDEWPDEKNVKCVPKIYDFLSYEKDILVLIFSALTSLFSAVSLFVLGSFIHYWDTPIVKANNRIVSFILLVSIFLSFLCVFLFLGRPMDITCLLRQMLFGIFFSISVSSVLGKTITVCIAFKATKPGSSWVKWVSLKVSNYVVVTCSSVQVLLCVMWLLVSPPYVEFDHHSYPGKIIIQCNEGSDLWFYSMLGYMGLLAAVSFLLAFMVRTLPDTFNEAKYITFSMLLFCSVWMSMIPAYLSTRGKYMVVVEIFAILTSCVGVLGCIFFPKLYVMILRPELNTRKIIIQK